MTKLVNLILAGICIILAGIAIIITESIGVHIAKIIIPLLFMLSGIFSIRYSIVNKDLEILSKFHLINGIGLLIFATVIAFLPDDLSSFLMYVTYFMLMYGLLEIVFPFSALNSKNKIMKELLIFIIIVGFAVSIGAIIILFTTLFNQDSGLMIAGILTLLIGLSNIIYVNKIKRQGIR